LPSTVTERFLTLRKREENYLNSVAKMFLLKTRLWEGMVPMAGQWWRELQSHEPDNWLETIDFLHQTIMVFEYFWHPSTLLSRRTMFNLVSAECATLQAALNARRDVKKIEGHIDLVALWREFIEHKFATTVD
jgi:hypothetical protein